MITIKDRNRLTHAISRYAQATVDSSWKGGGDPADIPEIEAAFEISRLKLLRVLDSITEQEPRA